MDGFKMDYLLADKGYDSDAIVAHAQAQGAQAVIPPRKHRKQPRTYDKALYKLRHLVENAFLHLKRWRGIATRYAKNVASFVAAVQIRCLALCPADHPKLLHLWPVKLPQAGRTDYADSAVVAMREAASFRR
jgi:transposase